MIPLRLPSQRVSGMARGISTMPLARPSHAPPPLMSSEYSFTSPPKTQKIRMNADIRPYSVVPRVSAIRRITTTTKARFFIVVRMARQMFTCRRLKL